MKRTKRDNSQVLLEESRLGAAEAAPSARRSLTGQVMILTVLALGGTILGATAIAGTLMLYQLRQASDLIKSSEAIYYADSGLECGLNDFFYELANPTQPMDFTTSLSASGITSCTNNNTTTVEFQCLDSKGASQETSDCQNATPTAVISIGSSGNVKRAFYISVEATSTVLRIPQ